MWLSSTKIVWDASALNSRMGKKRHLTNRCDNIQLINFKNLWKIWYELDLNDRGDFIQKKIKFFLNDRNKINEMDSDRGKFPVTYISSYKGLQTCFFLNKINICSFGAITITLRLSLYGPVLITSIFTMRKEKQQFWIRLPRPRNKRL